MLSIVWVAFEKFSSVARPTPERLIYFVWEGGWASVAAAAALYLLQETPVQVRAENRCREVLPKLVWWLEPLTRHADFLELSGKVCLNRWLLWLARLENSDFGTRGAFWIVSPLEWIEHQWFLKIINHVANKQTANSPIPPKLSFLA